MGAYSYPESTEDLLTAEWGFDLVHISKTLIQKEAKRYNSFLTNQYGQCFILITISVLSLLCVGITRYPRVV